MRPSSFILCLMALILAFTTGVLALPEPEQQELNPLQKREERTGENKYFHEPGGDDILGHYDSRYFRNVLSYANRTDTLTHMIRAYLITFRKLGLETWISHGTLLGWWWNGKILPWDWDLDTQVSGATLKHMANHLNRTMHDYVSADSTVSRQYLLDVNPWAWERTRGDGENIIDARWIDVRNGLYIDITGLSEIAPDVQPGVWVCKNDHQYHTKDLYPMRDNVFEGVRAMIPYAYDQMLTDEYGKGCLVNEEFHGHRWDRVRQEWVEIPKELEKKTKKEKKKGWW